METIELKTKKVNEYIDFILRNSNLVLDVDYLKQNNLSDDEITRIIKLHKLHQENNVETLKVQNSNHRYMNDSAKETFEVVTKLKKSLRHTLWDSKLSQYITTVMYVTMFGLGLFLIGVSIHFAYLGEEFYSILFGGFGIAEIVGQLVAAPPNKMQDSRSNYTQLTVGLLSWFSDFIDKSTVSAQVNQLGLRIFQTEVTDRQLKLHRQTLNQYMKLSDSHINNTVKLLTLIEELAEPTQKEKLIKAAQKLNEETKATQEKT